MCNIQRVFWTPCYDENVNSYTSISGFIDRMIFTSLLWLLRTLAQRYKFGLSNPQIADHKTNVLRKYLDNAA
jgi:hypothetical protein